MIRFGRFNIFLCGALLLLTAAGCRTEAEKKAKQEAKEATVIELHMETPADGQHDNGPVTIGREHPYTINIDRTPFMDGEFLDRAEVVDEPGGLFSIRLNFGWQGAALLDTMTSANPGKRIAVFCTFGKGETNRGWIASPIVTRHISNGVFTFTPSTTHEQAERIVRGLNNVAKQVKKDNDF